MLSYTVSFAVGAFAYTVLELAWRGYTHPSMTITGGACLALLYLLDTRLPARYPAARWLAGGIVITAVEFAVGCVVNLAMGQNVWDYSDIRFNLLGQICLPFSLAWCALAIPGYFICDIIRKYV